MKLYIKHIFAASAIGLYLSACSDFLDEKGYNTDYGYYKTSEGVEALLPPAIRMDVACSLLLTHPTASSFKRLN